MTISAQGIAQQASALAAQGRDVEADALYERGLADFPQDARLANSAGNFHFKAGRHERALALFERALAIAPDLVEAGVNAAIALGRLGRPDRAVTLLAPLESAASGHPNYWRIRADSERQAGRYRDASASMARAVALDPGGAKTARSRARLALERSDPQAVAHIETALTLNRGDPSLLFDYAQALAVEGRMGEALECTTTLVTHVPGWTDALKLHAELRWAAGEREPFADHFETITAMQGAGPAVWLAWCEVLDGVDRPAESAAILARARAVWPQDTDLALAQAVALGEAGAVGEAQGVLDQFAAIASPDWATARGRNLLRLGEIARAEAELATVLAARPTDVTAWALTDLCWRLAGDPRHEWLHGQTGLVRQLALPLDDAERESITALLKQLHRHSAMPIGQSVKRGSQTKGALFARAEPELARLEAALLAALAEYRAGLPAHDADHPLLSRRDDPWSIIGSWSIFLNGEGHHAAHIHPRGLLSSASYWLVPDEVDAPGEAGWLELGNPPPGLADSLSRLHAIRPQPGTLVLFPSTLFHGTRPITRGTRMTVAFDVTPTA
ncbi:tetratricopeptide repeat protein [Porphyrobacter sp. ULC335]|uniref:tetratricopeptide repeat protein n=1 Tax=Porphyrobacter sp. ULC335 TaxID=2854260 RepID=UPI00221F0F9D|nr:tetratricopeptide repeat protein [Porphyrobacter sp. ULC335]UYV17168.1 tetratricopeptide repeat protein [Porphyrobacter sp. ULC335]